jgi:DNA-binding Lrp family transcriptional regulator
VPSTVHDAEARVITHVNPDHVWDYVAKHHQSWRSDDVKILYMTRRHLQEDTSLIIDAKDVDVLSDFLTKHIATLKYVRGIWVVNMAKMRFFRIPMERPREFSRFTITISALPQKLEHVYKAVGALEPGRDIMINYIAQTYQSFKESIMVSVLARSMNHMDAFVRDCIKPIDGVLDTEISGISRTMRLVTTEEWEESVGPYFVDAGGEHIKDIEADDDSLMTGC